MLSPSLSAPSLAGPAAGPRLVALLASLAALGTLSTNILLPAFPDIAAGLGVPSRQMGLLLSSFLVAFALGQLVIGPLSDRIGRVRPILWGLALFVAGSLVAAGAASLEVLLAGRVLQALGVCAASVLSRAIARDLFEGAALARVLAFTMIAMAAAPGFSPLVGSLLAATAGWRGTILLVAVAGAVVALAYAGGLGETLPPERRARVSARATAAAYRGLAANAAFHRPALAVAAVVGGLYAFFGAAPEILLGAYHRTPLELGLFFAATVFIVFGAGLAAPRISARIGIVLATRVGAALALAGSAVLVVGSGLGGFEAGVVLFLAGMGLLNPLGTALALGPFAREAGLASALLGFLQMAIAAAATALLAQLPLPTQPALGAELAALSLAALALTLRLSR